MRWLTLQSGEDGQVEELDAVGTSGSECKGLARVTWERSPHDESRRLQNLCILIDRGGRND